MHPANAVAQTIVDAAYRIHSTLGPGLLESAYEAVLANDLQKRGLTTLRQHPISLTFDGLPIDVAFRADLIVHGLVIVELKSVEAVLPVHRKQLLTYLRLSQKQLGLLINFNVDRIKDGISRIVNGLPD